MVVAAAGNLDHAAVVRLVAQGVRAAGLLGDGPGRAGPAAHRRAPPRGPTRRRRAVAADRAGQLRAGRARASRAGRPPVRARRAQRRARRRDVEPAVPGGPREARAGVLGLLVQHPVRRHRALRRLRRLPARAVDEVLELCGASWRRSRARASPTRSCVAARASCAAALVLGLEDTGSRMSRIGKAELVYGELLGVDELLARIDARHPRRRARRRRRPAGRAADPRRHRPVRRVAEFPAAVA